MRDGKAASIIVVTVQAANDVANGHVVGGVGDGAAEFVQKTLAALLGGFLFRFGVPVQGIDPGPEPRPNPEPRADQGRRGDVCGGGVTGSGGRFMCVE